MKNVKKYEKQKWWIYIVQLVDLGLLKKIQVRYAKYM